MRYVFAWLMIWGLLLYSALGLQPPRGWQLEPTEDESLRVAVSPDGELTWLGKVYPQPVTLNTAWKQLIESVLPDSLQVRDLDRNTRVGRNDDWIVVLRVRGRTVEAVLGPPELEQRVMQIIRARANSRLVKRTRRTPERSPKRTSPERAASTLAAGTSVVGEWEEAGVYSQFEVTDDAPADMPATQGSGGGVRLTIARDGTYELHAVEESTGYFIIFKKTYYETGRWRMMDQVITFTPKTVRGRICMNEECQPITKSRSWSYRILRLSPTRMTVGGMCEPFRVSCRKNEEIERTYHRLTGTPD